MRRKFLHIFFAVKPVELWIPRDTSGLLAPFQLIDLINAAQNISNAKNLLMFHSFNLTGANVSIHIQIKPTNNDSSVGYLTLLKFGANPVFTQSQNNINKTDYDLTALFCPNDLQLNENDSFYLLFANMSLVNGFKGYVGFSVTKINLTQLGINCFNKSTNIIDLIISNLIVAKNQNEFTDKYYLRIYTSGCYYMDPLTDQWSSNGMEILPNSNLTHTHCLANHLTTFAGGFVVLPNEINFGQVWANASFLQNPVIYSTVIVLVCLYTLLAIWTRYMDWRDETKAGITILGNMSENVENKYIYEILVFTGNRPNAGTKSKVRLF